MIGNWRVGEFGALVIGRGVVEREPLVTSRDFQPADSHRGGPCGEVAQLVEHTTENRSVDSSILSLATTLLRQ